MVYVIHILLTTCEQDQDVTGSVLILLASCNCNLYDTYHCCVYSEKFLMMDRGTVRNMWSFIPKINLRNYCIKLVFFYMNPNTNTWKVLELSVTASKLFIQTAYHHHHHHHKHKVLDPLIRSVSRVTAVRANVSSVFQLFSFLVVCSGTISKGFGFVAFFAIVKASSVCIHLSCIVCL